MTKSEFEEIARSMVERRIRQVTYHEIDYGDNRFHFFDDSRFDSIDLAIDLNFFDDSDMTITWGSEFVQYGISLLSNQITNTGRILDVTRASRWTKSIGDRIASSQVFWNWCDLEGNGSMIRYHYPQDLLICFEQGGIIVLSALEIREKDWFMGLMDHITIFDDTEIAKQFKCFE